MAELSAAPWAAFLRRLVGTFKPPAPNVAPPKSVPEPAKPPEDAAPAQPPAESAPAQPAGVKPAKPSPRELQEQLIAHGLLDPPADGVLGPLSTWAMSQPKPAPLALGGDLAGRIVRAMAGRGHFIARHPGCLNIVYVEGIDPDGTRNDNAPNRFNDLRCLVRVVDGVPVLAGAWEATTEPSRRWTLAPMNPKGAARIAFGQYKAWALGTHHGHEALVQVADVAVFRDANKDYKREGDARDVGLFGINQHWGYDLPRNDLANSSAGCLVGRTTAGHRDFMRLLKSDKRFVVSNGAYRFLTTILPASALP
jgi:hypothetical protein